MKNRIIVSMMVMGVLLGQMIEAGFCSSCTIRRPVAQASRPVVSAKAGQRKKAVRPGVAKKVRFAAASNTVNASKEEMPVENPGANSAITESQNSVAQTAAGVVVASGAVDTLNANPAPSWRFRARAAWVACQLKAHQAWDKVRGIWS